MKRGTILWINLEPTTPPEFGKIRPGIIISNSEQNVRLPTVVIIPLSSQAPEIWPLRIGVKMPDGKESFIVIPGIRQVSKKRMRETISLAPPLLLEKIDQALAAYLGD
jgi:mRNA-degrading endonuclease toxin of MazEF toxin-antitoxin module